MFAVLIAFLCPVFHAASNIIDSHISNNVFKKLPTIIFYNCITNFMAVPLVLLFGMPQFVEWKILPYLFVVGAIDVLYQVPYYEALRRGDTSIICSCFSLGYIIVPVLAYFMVGEKLSIMQYTGFGIIIFFSLFLNVDNPKRIKVNASFYLMLLSSMLLAVQVVMYKYILESIDWISAIFYSAVFSTIVTLTFLIKRNYRQDIVCNGKPYFSRFKLFASNEVVNQLGTISSVYAMSFLPVVVIEGINATQSIFVLTFGIILNYLFGNKFRENISKEHVLKKFISFIFVVIGVILVV